MEGQDRSDSRVLNNLTKLQHTLKFHFCWSDTVRAEDDGCDEDQRRPAAWQQRLKLVRVLPRICRSTFAVRVLNPLIRRLTAGNLPSTLLMAPALADTTALLSNFSQFDRRDGCSDGGGAFTYTGLRIASIFIIMATSLFGALFPVLAKRSSWLTVPTAVFKYVIDTFFSKKA